MYESNNLTRFYGGDGMAQQSKIAEEMAAKRKDAIDDTVLIIDNAVPDPIALRIRALQAPFADLEIPGDGVYPRSCIVQIPELVEEVERTLGRKLSTVGTGFRLCYGGEVPQSFVHADTAYGTISAVLYLTLPDHCEGGTAFWKHKFTGLESTELGGSPNDWKDPDMWEQARLVDMQFNRLVVYPSNRFHSRWPQEAFGTGPENGRLTAVGFFNEVLDDTDDIKWAKDEIAKIESITVRPAVLDPLDDVEFILKSGKKFYLESGLQKLGSFDYLSLAKSVRDMIKTGQAIVLIAEKDGQRIGGISAYGYPLHFNQNRMVYQEQWWWVDPVHRGSGSGKMLLDSLEAEVSKRGGSLVVMMHLPKNNLGAKYKQAGYFPGETLYYKVLK